MIEMLQATLFTAMEEACNKLLQRDPVTLQHLERLDGKVILVQLNTPQLDLFLLPNADGLQIQSIYHDEPNVTLSGSATDFFKLLSSEQSSDAMFGKTVLISGDSALATRFQEILRDTRIDWEEMLAGVIGELPAHQLALYTAWKLSWYKNAGNSLLLNLDEYLKEEIRFLPSRPEVDHFYHEVDALKERAERLNAKILAIKSSYTPL